MLALAFDKPYAKSPSGYLRADTAHFGINGRVVDESGAPLPGATVFLSNSKWSAGTDNDGMFKLSGIPPGNYEILVRMMGFITFSKTFSITDRPLTVNATLKTDAIALNEVKVTAKVDPNRARYLRLFTENFIGGSDNARKSQILNPDVIRFNYNSATGDLTARAVDLIKVKNEGLGYTLNYLLNSFTINQQYGVFGYEGKVYFEELTGDEKQKKTWNRNRSSTYNGSEKHFLRALFAGTAAAEGFRIYKIADSELRENAGYSISRIIPGRAGAFARGADPSANLQPLNPDALFTTIDGNRKRLNLSLQIKDGDTTRIYICYMRNVESPRFNSTGGHINIPVKNAQISSIYQVGSGDIILNKDGSLSPEKGVMLEGYWAWQRVGELLPGEIGSSIEKTKVNGPAPQNEPLAQAMPVEKIHVQTDRSWYLTKDTAWMKVYVTDINNKLVDDNKICFIELIDKNKHIVKNLRLPLNMGTAQGNFALNDSLVKSGYYVIRAYTNDTQENDNPLFYKTIRIADLASANKKQKSLTAKQQPAVMADSLKVDFFPESGALLLDVDSKIAVAINAFGKPLAKIGGYIADERGYHIAKFETNNWGIAAFNIKPLKQGEYWAAIATPDGKEKRFALPKVQQTGIAMAVRQNSEDIVVYLNGNSKNYSRFDLVITANNRLQSKTEKLLTAEKDSVVISKADVADGLLLFSLYNADKKLMAQRGVYNFNKKRQLNVKTELLKNVYHPRDKIDMTIAVTDDDNIPVEGHFSVSVNNEADILDDKRTIVTDLLTAGYDRNKMLQSAIAETSPGKQAELDELLLTVKPVNATEKQIALRKRAPADTSLYVIKGIANTAKGKPAASTTVSVLFPLGGPLLTTTSDVNGRFTFNNIPVKRGDPFYIVAKDKHEQDLKVTIDKHELPALPDNIFADTVESDDNIYTEWLNKRLVELDNLLPGGKQLKEVTIKEKKTIPLTLEQILTQSSSNIGARPDQILTFVDLLNCIAPTLGECLNMKLRNVYIRRDSLGNISIYSAGRSNWPMAIFVDGVERKDALRNVSTYDVASVEVLKGANAAAYGMRGGNGVVIITTKTGGLDYWAYEQEHYQPGSTKKSPIERYNFENGFDVGDQFYSPDYHKPQANGIENWRPTLYWNPDVTTGIDGKAKLSYFTNNAPGSYRVTIEGVDGYGRIARKIFNYTVTD